MKTPNPLLIEGSVSKRFEPVREAFIENFKRRGELGGAGSMGYADPATGIGYGYVTNKLEMHLEGDPRDLALRAAIPAIDRRPASVARTRGAVEVR